MRVVDDTQSDLERLIAIDFGGASTDDFENNFDNWIHYRARRVPQLPRKVFISQEVSLHKVNYPAIENICLALMGGGDVGPWLSDKIQRNKTNYRADMMFNDWQITHFHLGRIFKSPTTIHRTKPLLFAHITSGEATLLDVQPHGSWTKLALLKILLRTNPTSLDRYEGRGLTPPHLTDEQYRNLRANGYNTLVGVAGRGFIPGGGRMATGHAMRLCLYRDWFFRAVEKLRQDFEADLVEPRLKSVIYARLGVPIKLGAYYDDRGMAIIDKNRGGLVLHQMKPLE